MCGICFICQIRQTEDRIDFNINDFQHLLEARGPDKTSTVKKTFSGTSNEICIDAQFIGSTLWLQGATLTEQPVEDELGNILLWNGDILSGHEVAKDTSDTFYIKNELEQQDHEGILSFLSKVKGPWAIIYYQKSSNRLYFGRDVFGRHSLVWRLPTSSSEDLVISSLLHIVKESEEVPALGIYYIDFNTVNNASNYSINLIPWTGVSDDDISSISQRVCVSDISIPSPISSKLNTTEPDADIIDSLQSQNFLNGDLEQAVHLNEENITNLMYFLKQSIQRRTDKCPNKCIDCTTETNTCTHSKYGVLFSGGLDSAVIGLILSRFLPPDESIDLLNVAFEQKPNKQSQSSNLSFNVPDRLSGLQCWKELCEICPERHWNFIEIDVTGEELKEQRESIIKHLVWPLSSVLDDSIGCALWFAGRGQGMCCGVPYKSTARVLLCGMGADEQFAGYSRHRAKFNNGGWTDLISEVDMEMSRIYKRNLGRDNRILAHHGRAPRFPFLDEDFVTFLNTLPIHEKTNLYLPRGIGEKYLLRVTAAHLGLQTAASLPKRAIQFGSRIAKLENSKEKGSDVCSRIDS